MIVRPVSFYMTEEQLEVGFQIPAIPESFSIL